ncbi:helix-turn-helix domain-containing protein [Streptomyces roseicoloratus]|uniref:Helix-turn-helix domain-containing protein n=1 Tax=Streptomyces roseicoloratus TaxID=2508722 RepID=A0ABY9RTB0_9ACTN|nr:sigma factor-like helix-turn-helix DNA-binding protein [Streptomyces roseicoloratus]WMX45442.1 helix-turn-helix domain-containing protein [Streptomyces roseicoloratus]
MSPTSPSVSLPSPKERRRLREALSLSEDQVAEALGVTRATVRAWETGRSSPRGRKREAYAKLLGIYEEPTAPRPEKPARPSSAATRPRPAAMGTARPPKTPTAAPAGRPPGARGTPPSLGGRIPAAGGAPETCRPARRADRLAPLDRRVGRGCRRDRRGCRRDRHGRRRGRRRDRRGCRRDRQGCRRGCRRGAGAPVEVRPATPGREDVTPPEAGGPGAPGLTPEEAFDALYAYAAPSLVHQTYLLTGRRRLSRESVEFAFHHAWQHWPEVAVDRDPVGWVRAAAYEYALSPWHRFRRRHRHPDSAPTEASRRALLGALLELPPPYRRTVLLYDGLGLDLPETAAETEASTPAAGNRLLHARTVIGRRVPELSDPEALHRRLAALVAEAPTATLPAARAVRTGSERRSRRLTRTVIGVTAALICVTAVTAATAPTRYIPAIAPGMVVDGVPVRGGPQKLGPEDKELRDMLRTAPNPGPERLVPAAE